MDLHQEALHIVSKLSLDEKCKLCVGKNFWQLYGVDSLEIPSIWLSDGPHGLRQEKIIGENISEGKAEPSVCYPTGATVACSFDEELIFKMGKGIGEECREKNVAVILGPGANEMRLPTCGRNFEYLSEDPYLTGKMAAAYIKGVQSQGVGTSLKHFMGNNQEKYRMTTNSIIDERALREIYLRGMEIAIKEGNPWTVMMAYNRVNGEYCCENSFLMKDVLRNEWKYDGLIISDWGGVNSFLDSRKSGLDLEMPGFEDKYYETIKNYIKEGKLSEEIVDESVTRIIELILKYRKGKEIPYTSNLEEHLKLAQTICEESSVLLKNEDSILPGNINQSIAVIGEYAKHPRYQGLGSSQVNPIELDNAYEAFIEYGCNVDYAKGYPLKYEETNENELLQEAVDISKGKDIVYLFLGFFKEDESEALDEKSINLPKSQVKLIEEINKVNKNIVVILQGGIPIATPWSYLCKGILLTKLGGSRSGHATVNLLLGFKNPCGKLSQTFAKSSDDYPSMKYYPGDINNEEYRESIYVGYRYFDSANIEVNYPFGYGLSYTSFEFDNLNIKTNKDDSIRAQVTITNSGDKFGKEVVQVYVSCLNSILFRAKKELKSFKKIALNPGESKTIDFILNRESFQYYNVNTHSFQVEGGYYKIHIASSSEDIKLSKLVYINGDEVDVPDYRELTPSYYKIDDKDFYISQEEFTKLYGDNLPIVINKNKPFTINSTLHDVKKIIGGKIIVSLIHKSAYQIAGDDENMKAIINENLEDFPFRTYCMMTRGGMSRKFIDGFVFFLNRKYIKGIKIMLKEFKNKRE